MNEEMKKDRIELFKEILKVIDDCTNLDGHARVANLKRELSINVFSEICDEDLLDNK